MFTSFKDSFMRPFVSVLIPAYNEEDNILKCLESIHRQTYPNDRYEIIVMDNGSTDSTYSLALGVGCRVIDAKGLSIGGVRNIGANLSNGEVLAYIDADCVAGNDWLDNGVDILYKNSEVGAVGGKCYVPDGATWVQRAWGWKCPEFEMREANILSTGSFFVKTNVFIEVGGFNDSLTAGEDTEISRKIVNTDRKLYLSSKVGVIHLGYPSSIFDFVKRQIWQSTDYIKTTKNKKDPVFVLVHLFLISAFASLFSAVFFEDSGSLVFIFVVATIAVAMFLSIYRHIKLHRGSDFLLLLQSIVLNYLYLLGRSIGLIKSYFRLMFYSK